MQPAAFDLPAPVQREVAVGAGGTIYLAGGLDSAGRSTDGVFSVDPGSGRVRLLGALPRPVHDAAGALLGGHVLLFGGGSASSTDAVQSFDLSSLTGRVAGRLPTALSDLSAATIGSTVYLVGGFDGISPRREIYATSDGTSFRVVGRLPEGLRYAAVAPAGGRVIVAGGISPAGPVRDIWAFDPAAGTVRSIGQLPLALGHAAAIPLGSLVVVVGGADAAGRPLRSVAVIDASTGRVQEAHALSQPLSDAGVAVADGVGWILGGLRTTAVSDVLRVANVGGCSSGP